MSHSARVASIDSLADFRAKLCEFGKDGKDTLCSVDLAIRRAFDWLEERVKYWKFEIKKRQEEVVRAKIELTARKNMCKEGRGPGTTDQEKALRRAQARLQEAEDKLASCKRWHPQLQHAVHEYQAPARLLGGTLDGELVQMLALLANKITALEAYLAIQAPSFEPPPAASDGSDVPAGMAAGNDAAVTPHEAPPPESLDAAAQPTSPTESGIPDSPRHNLAEVARSQA
jgi:hypothetical protein